MDTDDLIDIEEVARLFEKSVESMRKYKNYGILKVVDRKGNKDLFSRQDVLRRKELVKRLQVETGLTLSQIADQIEAYLLTAEYRAPRKQTEHPHRESRLRVLVADDESIIREAMQEVLGQEYIIIEAVDGPSTVEQAMRMIPDLILLDLRMPGMDGYQVCQILKGNPLTAHIPIIMITALTATPEKVKGIEYGADDYITKPFDTEELKARIKMVMRRPHSRLL
jgi:CheY-like chemotaxis protein